MTEHGSGPPVAQAVVPPVALPPRRSVASQAMSAAGYGGQAAWKGFTLALKFLIMVIVAVWIISRAFGVPLEIGIWSFTLVIAGFGALVLEFKKSSDVGQHKFRLDLTLAVVTVIASSVTMALLVEHGRWYFADWVMWIITLIDVTICPWTSYNTALRNVQAAVGNPHNTPDADT